MTVNRTDSNPSESAALDRWLDDGGPDEREPPTWPLSASILTPAPEPLDVERQANRAFACTDAAPEYREQLARLYARWDEFNIRYFGGRLRVPHLTIGRTATRRFSDCRLTTDYGGAVAITLNEGIAFGTNNRIVRSPFPAPGLVRFEDDLLLGETVKQYVLVELGAEDVGWGGYGPRYATEATRIGEALGLGPVLPRRRPGRGFGQPVAAFWPWAFRPPGYYLGDVQLDHVRVAGLRTTPSTARIAAVPGVYEYFLFLLLTGQALRLIDLLGRLVDVGRETRDPALIALESGPHDANGKRVPLPQVDSDWLTWNGGCIPAIAAGIRARRAFAGMPILADALQDAGCNDPIILDHCRGLVVHTANCWILRLLTEHAEA